MKNTKLQRNAFKKTFRKKLKNVKTFESFVNESATKMYRGDFEKAKEFYAREIAGQERAEAILDALVNDEEGSDEDMVQYLQDEFGLAPQVAQRIVSGRDLFIGQIFDPRDLS